MKKEQFNFDQITSLPSQHRATEKGFL
jgi:hypothetical protein